MAMKNKPYTLVFGLTADPIHKGHEQVILNSFTFANQQKLCIEKFLLVPTYQPNLIANKKQPRTSFEHRFKMCKLVATEITKQFKYPLEVSEIEKQLYLKNNKKSYSYNTLKAIIAQNKLFVLSADHFAGRWPKFRKWHNWQALVKENGLLIHQRHGHGINASFIQQLKAINPVIFVINDLPSIDISSTEIRQSLASKTSITQCNLLSHSVLDFINNKKLYR